MTTVSCIIITTLIVVSLANLILLVHVIIHSINNKCQQSRPSDKKNTKVFKRENYFTEEVPYYSNSFAFLLILNGTDDSFEFVCGVAVISERWVLTTTFCIDPILDESRTKMKISLDLKNSQLFDVDEILLNKKSESFLLHVQQPFKRREDSIAILPSKSFKYLAYTNATVIGWIKTETVSANGKLLPHKLCQRFYYNSISNIHFCIETTLCDFKYEGFLIQNKILIGIIHTWGECGKEPSVYTKSLELEDWLKRKTIANDLKLKVVEENGLEK